MNRNKREKEGVCLPACVFNRLITFLLSLTPANGGLSFSVEESLAAAAAAALLFDCWKSIRSTG